MTEAGSSFSTSEASMFARYSASKVVHCLSSRAPINQYQVLLPIPILDVAAQLIETDEVNKRGYHIHQPDIMWFRLDRGPAPARSCASLSNSQEGSNGSHLPSYYLLPATHRESLKYPVNPSQTSAAPAVATAPAPAAHVACGGIPALPHARVAPQAYPGIQSKSSAYCLAQTSLTSMPIPGSPRFQIEHYRPVDLDRLCCHLIDIKL